MGKHTPGPWKIGEPQGFDVPIVTDNELLEVCTVWSDEYMADSRLIAAAPELLEALNLLVAGIEGSVSPTFIPLGKARAAIAKATGGEV